MAYLRLFFSNMPLYSEIFKCREFESFQPVFFGFFHLWFLTSFFRRLGIKKARRYGLFGTFIYFVSAIWRRWWDSNPRGAHHAKTISSRSRYDLFDTSPSMFIRKILSNCYFYSTFYKQKAFWKELTERTTKYSLFELTENPCITGVCGG